MKNKTLIAITVIIILSMNALASDKVTVYFFWSNTCPHCLEMEPFIEKLPTKYPQIEIKKFEIHNQENLALLNNLSEAYNTTIGGVPDAFVGNKVVIGYGGTKTENLIQSLIENCSRDNCQSPDQILKEYLSRPKPTTTSTTTTTTAKTTTTTSTTTSRSTTTTTEPASTTSSSTTATTEPTTMTTEPVATTTTKPENNTTTIQPWVYGTIGIALILITYGLTAKKKSTLKGGKKT